MTFDPSSIALPSARTMKPYETGEPLGSLSRRHGIAVDELVKLNANENPYGPSPAAINAIEASLKSSHRYPDARPLLEAVASHHNVSPGQIVLGIGSTGVIDVAARTFLAPGTEAISSQYGFAMFAALSSISGARNVIVPAKDYAHDLPAMAAAVTDKTRVIWIANPNNPTGTFAGYEELKVLLESVHETTLVVIDEAYYDYLEPDQQTDTANWLAEHPNLIILRTFSKVYGLAGLRIGYGITDEAVAALLNKVRQPLSITAPAVAGATAALADKDFTRESARRNRKQRDQLTTGLERLGLKPLPAYGNFVTVSVPNGKAAEKALLGQGVIVRPLDAYNLPDHIRITVGTGEENGRLLTNLGKALSST